MVFEVLLPSDAQPDGRFPVDGIVVLGEDGKEVALLSGFVDVGYEARQVTIDLRQNGQDFAGNGTYPMRVR